MYIERIEIEEGFLDGFALDLSPQLNVVIGPRGSGKTSLVELIRFCLDIQAYEPTIDQKVVEQVRNVLGRGRVALIVNVDGEQVRVTRSADDAEPQTSKAVSLDGATVLSQTEIELVADDAEGRLRLLDGFRSVSRAAVDEENRVVSQIRSLTKRLLDLNDRAESAANRFASLAPIAAQLVVAEAEQALILEAVGAHDAEKLRLEELAAGLESATAQRQRATSLLEQFRAWRDALADAARLGVGVPSAEGEEPVLDEVAKNAERAKALIREAQDLMDLSLRLLAAQDIEATESHRLLADESRTLRRTLDEVVQGAGAASSKVGLLREQLASRDDVASELQALRSQVEQIRDERSALLDELDNMRATRFDERQSAADDLNSRLGPSIRVELERYGGHGNYAAAIAEALRGTKLHYNPLSLVLAAALSPRELMDAADEGDVSVVEEVAGIDAERAGRVLQALRDDGGAEILACEVDDAVEFLLLDGTDYKPSGALSTGQRCTVVLPMLLEQSDRLIVIDQPEDHLDNSFIVQTVVSAIRGPGQSQRIIATHNANIPVLGNAELVISLASDGRSGFIDAMGPLDTPAIVDAITTIMEGGRAAFAERARFYGSDPVVTDE